MLINANALHIPLKTKSVQCCVTSPPYWGLRDYGTAKWVGGDVDCDHLGKPMSTRAGFNERYFDRKSSEGNKQDTLREPYKNVCEKCGAIRIDNQLGLEQTPEEYVENIVTVFREVWRVLRDDGVLWLSLGDSYSGGGRGCDTAKQKTNRGTRGMPKSIVPDGLKPKDLVGIPWRVAFALQSDGWYLRNDIIWHKPNPMPESVKDRCTKSHEYIFLLAKNKKYYYDNESIKEDAVTYDSSIRDRDSIKLNNTPGRSKMAGLKTNAYSKRNKRTVWKIAPRPYKGAHFATFPPELPELCIKAGSSEGDIVLDPFVGSGTTCMVARDLGRMGIGLDLSLNYLVNNAKKRLEIN